MLSDTFKLNVQETKYMVFCKAHPMGFDDYYIVTSDGKTSERVHGKYLGGWIDDKICTNL